MKNFRDIDKTSINTIRALSIDMVQKANSGHPGLPLGVAPMAYVLWSRHLRFNPSQPTWLNRDRFVLSAGHGSAMLYSLLHLFGYKLSMNDLRSFRQIGSITPGHPEAFHTLGVEATTGPLGQGTANAVGMAIAENYLARYFNRDGFELFNHYTYALVSDGDMMEGISAEASSLAGHLKLGKLIFLYDSNSITIDGSTSLCFSSEDVAKRYESYGWQVLSVADGDTDLDSIDTAIIKAKRELTKPSLIIIKTTIGYGSPNKAGKSSSHGSPLGVDEVKLTKEALGCDQSKSFHIPTDVKSYLKDIVENKKNDYETWRKLLDAYKHNFPDKARELTKALKGELPRDWNSHIPTWNFGDSLATREASGATLNAIASKLPFLIGGSADLASSNLTIIKKSEITDREGKTIDKNIYFGIREHAMAGIANGMAYFNFIRPFVSTFLVFSDYMKPSIRLAALSRLPVIYVFTHDSLAVGEDGPTHQPIEPVMSLRLIPNLTVIRPCDAIETADAWRWAIENPNSPIALILSRQKLPVINRDRAQKDANVKNGAYIMYEPRKKPRAIIIATGSEVAISIEAAVKLEKHEMAVRVVSMPSWELFESQSDSYKESVLPKSITKRISVEAGVTHGWRKYLGENGIAIGIDTFGLSGKGDDVMSRFGFNAENIIAQVKKLISR